VSSILKEAIVTLPSPFAEAFCKPARKVEHAMSALRFGLPALVWEDQQSLALRVSAERAPR
jgi:hypothetical protein